MGDRGGHDDRVCLPGEDDAGIPGAAGVRARVRGGGAYDLAQTPLADTFGSSRDRDELRLVGSDRGPLAGLLAADDRRLARQQYLQPDLWLQRSGTDLRCRRPRRRGRRRSELQWSYRTAAAVRERDGRAGLLALAGGRAGADRGPVAESSRTTYRPHPCGTAAVGRVATGERRGVQLW